MKNNLLRVPNISEKKDDSGSCCLPEFQRLACQEVRELHSPQILHWVPSYIRSYFPSACKCRRVLNPHSNSIQLPGNLPSIERELLMCLRLSDMLVTLWLCQHCSLQPFSDAAFKWKQLLGLAWHQMGLFFCLICSMKRSSD